MDCDLHILLLEDDPADVRLICETLKMEGVAAEVKAVDSRPSFVAAVESGGFDLVLADYKLPGFDGLEALKLVQAQHPATPFIFVTGALGEERAIETLKRGATDYILKDRLSRLAPAVRRAVAEAEEHRRRKEAERERERLLEELARERVTLHAIMEHTRTHLAYLDPQFNFVHVNSTYVQGCGRTREELIGRNHFDVFPDANDRAIFERVRDTAQAAEFQARTSAIPDMPESSAKFWDWNLVPVKGAGGQVLGLVVSLLDVTERMRNQQALQSERDFTEAVLNTQGALVMVLDPQGRIERFNRSCQLSTGYSFEEVKGRAFWDFLLPTDEVAAVKEKLADPAALLMPFRFEGCWMGKDGRRRRIEWSHTWLLDVHGAVQHVIATGIDVTLRYEAEEQVRILSRAIEAGPANVVITDARGCVVYVNPAWIQASGFSREEIIGHSPRLWKSGHHPPEFYDELWSRLKQGQDWRGELCDRRRNGALFWIYASISPVKDGRGKTTHYVAVTVDITERKRQEEALRQAQQELEQKVQDRTVELTEAIRTLETEIEARRKAEAEVQERLRFEQLVTELSTRFASVSAEQFDRELASGLEQIGQFLRMDHGVLGERTESGAKILQQWLSPGRETVPGYFPQDCFPWTQARLLHGELVHFCALAELPPEATQDKEAFARLRTNSLLAIPLEVDRAVIGVLAFGGAAERPWPKDTLQRLRLVADLYASALFRYRSEKALAEARLRFHTVADFVQEWEVWLLPDGTIGYCSPACERMTGYTAAELMARPELLASLVHPDDRAVWLSHTCEAGATHGLRTIQFRICPKDGGINWIEHTCKTAFDSQGRFHGIRACNRDITAAKTAELEAQQLRQDLARVSCITTAGQLAASLAHELNQPLAAILANAQAARRFMSRQPPDLQEVVEALEEIVQADQRAGGVIRRLRSLFTRSPREMARLDLNQLIGETLALLRGEFILQNVSVVQSLPADLPPVWGNRIELQQVLLNLLMNAVQAMGQIDPARRTLRIATALESDRAARVSVCDSGPGLAPEHLNRMFEPFFTTKATGMGMGLAISLSVIEAHGGKLWAANNPDCGATFYFTVELPEAGQP